MPIDPDAYMAGAIPTLSRGGSWLPALHGDVSSFGSAVNSNAQDGNPRLPPLSFNACPPWSPLHPISPFCPDALNSPGMPQPGYGKPMWSTSYLGYGHSPGIMTVATPFGSQLGADDHPTCPSTPPLVDTTSPQTTPSTPSDYTGQLQTEIVEPNGYQPKSHAPIYASQYPAVSQGPEPLNPSQARKPITPLIHRRRAESLPSPPGETPAGPVRSSHLPTRKSNKQEERERTASGSGKRMEARRSRTANLAFGRSYSYTQLNTVKETAKVRKDVAPDYHKRSPPKLDINTQSAKPLMKVQSTYCRAPSPESPYIKLGRPPTLRRHTSYTSSSSSSPITPKRERFLSSPERREKTSHSQTGPAVRQAKHPHSSSPASSRGRSCFDMAPLANPLPEQPQEALTHLNSGKRSRSETSYVSPLSRDGYDRYAAHPNVPTDETDRYTTHASSPTITQEGNAAAMKPEYVPVGSAAPTKELAWNRDGPAMKTHGVAWKRHSENLVLPKGPQGPRLIQAKPPRVDIVTGGGWWESGGQ